MSRRMQRPEQEFGSDSFLDVIANIVGILIILIVIVGMKVARQQTDIAAVTEMAVPAAQLQPVAAEPAAEIAAAETAAQQEQQRQLVAEREQQLQSLQERETQTRARLTAMQQQRAEQEQTRRSQLDDQQLTALQIASLQQQLQQAGRQQQAMETEKSDLQQVTTQLQAELQQVQQTTAGVERAVALATSEEEQLNSALQQVALETQQLREVLHDLEATAEPANRLEHRLSPVSEKVEEGELHFRVADGRISYVPLEELLDRLKAQIQARRAAVTRFTHYEGSVGPVLGYRMSYTVERDSMSPLEAMQYGGGTYRISVSKWTVVPDDSLESEAVAAAVRPGSRFRQLAETAAPGSAITFWIYPNSFTDFPALREVAHGLQLRVAARPLPDGTPIVGSPGGSRSAAQ